jgi:Glycoside Hydrolase Family 113
MMQGPWRWGRIVGALVFLGGCGSGGSSPGPSSPPSTTPAGAVGPPFAVRALNHVVWWHDGYLGAQPDDSRQAIVATRANWAAVLVTWYMDRRDSNTILPDSQQTPAEDSVAHAVGQLHSLGFKVMLKPHVDVKDGSWRGTIRPADTGLWFSSYDAFLVDQARFAAAHHVELLDIGTELVTMSDSRFASQWTNVIQHIRGAFAGQLTYGANANAPGDEFTSVSFWSQLDYAGLDVYVPLTNHADPTLAEVTSAWSRNVNGDNMLAAYKNWQAGHGKPVLFTEMGYRSLAGGNRAPYDFSLPGAPDPSEQATCYEAAFSVWSKETPWLKGVFWWAWPTTPAPGPNDTDYTPRGKPAETVLQRWFGS